MTQAEGRDGGPRAAYQEKERHHAALRDAAAAASKRLSTLRVFTFLGIAAALVLADVLQGTAVLVALAVAGVGAAGFVLLVARHRRCRRDERWHETLRALAQEGLYRLSRAWDALEGSLPEDERRVVPVDPRHPFARDLDVVGRASLTRLMGPVTSVMGRSTLRSWLLEAAAPDVASLRAEAAQALRAPLERRLELAAYGRLAADADQEALDAFLAWAEGEAWVARHPWLRAAAFVLPLTIAATVFLDLFLGWPPLWVIPGVAQAVVLQRFLPRLSAGFHGVASMRGALGAYVPQLEALAGWPAEPGMLAALHARLGAGGKAAHRRLARLEKLADTVDSRHNMVYAALAPVFLLDVHLAHRLDVWRMDAGEAVRDWLTALGELEALSALASLAHDHPDWVSATWMDEGEARLEARALGHPLLPPEECVRNDVQVGPPGSFLLVTGSNMSGKSTLLRAVGTNVVLAGAGAPVCAASFALFPFRVWTSMRVEDDLARGVSLFMAELLRVRDMVEAATAGDGPPVLYLLDEILHGTNTAERRVAARAVLRHLVDEGAVGAVSTHDLTLAESPDLTPLAHNVHFREQVSRVDGRTRLDFDYRLRPGVATTRNALRLLEAVGLDWEELHEE